MARNSGLIDKFFQELEQEIVATAGIAASSYAKDASKEIAEEWAEILARNIELGLNVDSLAIQTKKNRDARLHPQYPPLFETGELVSNIEIRWTSVPQKNYDIVEVGIWDNSTLIGHDSDITPYQLGLMNEYGFEGEFEGKDGKIHKINIPARPHFSESAIDIGYEVDRIATDSWRKVQVAVGREKRSIISNNLGGRPLYDLAVDAPSRYGGTGTGTTKVGRFSVRGRKIVFAWDENASDTDEESFD